LNLRKIAEGPNHSILRFVSVKIRPLPQRHFHHLRGKSIVFIDLETDVKLYILSHIFVYPIVGSIDIRGDDISVWHLISVDVRKGFMEKMR
jgi:hypothetical protein